MDGRERRMKRTVKYIITAVLIAFTVTTLYASCSKKEKVYTEEDFIDAIRYNKIEIVEACLAQGMSVETPASNGTVLNYAIWRDRKEIAMLLLDHGADVNKTQPLVNAHDPEMIQLLLEHGANPNFLLGEYTLLMFKIEGNVSNFSSKETGKQEYEKMLKSIELLLQHGADPNYYSEETGLSALLIALNYELREAVDILLKYGAVPRSKPVRIDFDYDPLNFRQWDEDYGVVWQSDLLMFAYDGYTDLLMPYIENGKISPDSATPLGHDFYYYAVWGGHPDTIMALLPYLKDINSKRYNNGHYSKMSLLFLAGINNNVEAVKVLLENGANYRLLAWDKNGFEYETVSTADIQAKSAMFDYMHREQRYPEYKVTKKAAQ